MPNYAIYTRTFAGDITRVRNFSSNYPRDLLKLNFHEGSLIGFPENTVFWLNLKGPSIGFAPCLDMKNPPN
jgi:hypothetical protein